MDHRIATPRSRSRAPVKRRCASPATRTTRPGIKRRARKLGDFRSLADKYLAAKKRDLRPASTVEYERILTKVKEKFGDEPAAKIERRALREYLAVQGRQNPFYGEPLLRSISAGSTTGREGTSGSKRIARVTVDGLKRPFAEEPSRERHLTTDEIRRVWSAVEKERPMMAIYFKLLFFTAVRRSEGTTARWSPTLTTKNACGGFHVIKTKNKKEHVLPLIFRSGGFAPPHRVAADRPHRAHFHRPERQGAREPAEGQTAHREVRRSEVPRFTTSDGPSPRSSPLSASLATPSARF